jgi:hypothetical protein
MLVLLEATDDPALPAGMRGSALEALAGRHGEKVAAWARTRGGR